METSSSTTLDQSVQGVFMSALRSIALCAFMSSKNVRTCLKIAAADETQDAEGNQSMSAPFRKVCLDRLSGELFRKCL